MMLDCGLSDFEFRTLLQPAEGSGESISQAFAQGLVLGSAADILADTVFLAEVFDFYSNIVAH